MLSRPKKLARGKNLRCWMAPFLWMVTVSPLSLLADVSLVSVSEKVRPEEFFFVSTASLS